MRNFCTIIYANRNKEPERIRSSFNSLSNQTRKNFEVVFVDYGSDKKLVEKYTNIISDFPFVRFYHLPVQQLLWNKSKALNYGILNSQTPFIFIADVDIIFHSKSIDLFSKIAVKRKFQLFKMAYLNKNVSKSLESAKQFDDLNYSRIGNVNGMILVSREALLDISGFDEFFHFYGAEDVDLFSRLENSGLERQLQQDVYFFHNWHKSFTGTSDKLSTNPRVKNIMRINERHYIMNKELEINRPFGQNEIGGSISLKNDDRLSSPNRIFEVPNIKAYVEHFLKEELKQFEGEVVKVKFVKDPYYKSLKYKTKVFLGKQSQKYMSMKEVNDLVLKEILFNYRDQNYWFRIADDLKTITFCIEL